MTQMELLMAEMTSEERKKWGNYGYVVPLFPQRFRSAVVICAIVVKRPFCSCRRECQRTEEGPRDR